MTDTTKYDIYSTYKKLLKILYMKKFKEKYVEFRKRISYTWKHKKAFLKVEKEKRGYNTLRGYFHDVDKLFLYWLLLFGMSAKDVQKIHRKINGHHDGSWFEKTRARLIEMIFDWECASLTKPDKPLLAFATMLKVYPHLESQVMPLMVEFGLITHQAIEQAVELGLCSRIGGITLAVKHGWVSY